MLQRVVEAPLEADRRGRLRAHPLAAERAGDVAGEHLDAVGAARAAAGASRKRPSAPSLRADGEVGPGSVADEERVARQHEPRLARPGSGRRPRGTCARAGGPGVWIARRTTLAELDLVRRPSARRARTRPPRRDGSRPARRARARAGRGPRGGRRACASRRARTIATPRRSAASSSGSIAKGGSTTAATPASSSPIRYDAQPRSSSRNCWKSTVQTLARYPGFPSEVSRRGRAARPGGGGGRGRRSEQHERLATARRGTGRTTARSRSPGTTVTVCVDLDRLAVGEPARSGRACRAPGAGVDARPARPSGSPRRRLPAAGLESMPSPAPSSSSAVRRRRRAGGPAARSRRSVSRRLLEQARLHVQMRERTGGEHETGCKATSSVFKQVVAS